MSSKSIQSYNLLKRVSEYDTDMNIMHPNRSKMTTIALEFLPFDGKSSFTALELGSGTGYFTKNFLKRFPNSRIIAIDGAGSMIDLAKQRLGGLRNKVDFRIGDFRNLNKLLSDKERGSIVFSSYALHHLKKQEKSAVIKSVVSTERIAITFSYVRSSPITPTVSTDTRTASVCDSFL